MWKWIQRQASPKIFYQTCVNLRPWFLWPFLILLVIGLYWSLLISPEDYQQGDGYRIIYIHVPSAILSMMVYAVMAIAGGIGLIWQIKMAEVVAKVSAPIGAAFTIIALSSGAIWGKPMWGTWWVWDARLTSELILFFIYLSIIFLYHAYDDYRKGAKAANILAIVGFINIPIIHFSVEWWNTLHQGPSVMKFSSPSIASEMLYPLIYTAVGFTFYFILAVLLSARNTLLEREKNTSWAKSI